MNDRMTRLWGDLRQLIYPPEFRISVPVWHRELADPFQQPTILLSQSIEQMAQHDLQQVDNSRLPDELSTPLPEVTDSFPARASTRTRCTPSEEILRSQAATLARQGHLDEAEQLLFPLINSDATSIATLHLLARIYAQRGSLVALDHDWENELAKLCIACCERYSRRR
jgi:hypothetical protein